MASAITCIFTDLVKAIKKVLPDKSIFLGVRPIFAESSTRLDRFAVIKLPISIEDIAAGKKKFVLQTTGVIDLYSRAKNDRTFRINELSDFQSSVEDLFPISGDYCVAADPTTLIQDSDEFGYQVISISFNLHTRAGVFQQTENS